MSYCRARSCCCRMWEVRLAVRYQNGLRSDDPTRWWMDRASRLSKDHSNRLSMAMNHCLSRSLIRFQSRSANSCQIRWWNGWSTRERYSFHFRCNLADRCWIGFLNHRCLMARSLIPIRYLIRFEIGSPTHFANYYRCRWSHSPTQIRCRLSNWAPSSSAMSNSVPICYRCLDLGNPIGFPTRFRFPN